MRWNSSGPFAVVLLCTSVPGALPAQDHRAIDASIAFRAGTLGFGLEAGKLLVPHLGARVGANIFKLNRTGNSSDISYDFSLRWKAVSALVDYFPRRRGAFHLSAGLITKPLTIDATGRPTSSGTFEINHHQYTAAQVGTLTGDGRFTTAPYLGLGFGTPAKKGRVEVLFDLGAVLGKAKITLSATGAASNQQLAADLAAQSATTQKDLDKYAKVYPVLDLGIGVRF